MTWPVDATAVHLTAKRLVIDRASTSRTILYGDAPGVRDAVRRFVSSLAEHARHVLFADVCTQCGKCCTRVESATHPGSEREEVLVTAKEAFALARHLGLSDDDFRRRHLAPARSWNADDGLLRFTEEGHCPFLERSRDGRAGRCSVYDVRPFSCQAFMPNHPMCVKTAEQLVEQLVAVDVGPMAIEVETAAGGRHVLPVDDCPWTPALEDLLTILGDYDEKKDERVPPIVAGIQKLLDSLKAGLDRDPRDPSSREMLKEIRDLLGRVSNMVELRSTPSLQPPDEVSAQRAASLEALWADVAATERRMDDAVAVGGDAEPEQAEAGPTAAADTTERPAFAGNLLIMPEILVAVGTDGSSQPLHLRREAPVLASVRALIEAVAKWGASDVALAMADLEPPCYLCGECCRAYAVEVSPTDIRRLAWNLDLAYDDVVETYTIAPRFTWNEGHRILKKRPSPRECVFLEQREDGLHYCGIHAFKPDICRAYQPVDRLCRQTNDATHWSRFIGNIVWLRLQDDRLLLCTHRTHTANQPPLEVELSRRPLVEQRALALRAAVADALAAPA